MMQPLVHDIRIARCDAPSQQRHARVGPRPAQHHLHDEIRRMVVTTAAASASCSRAVSRRSHAGRKKLVEIRARARLYLVAVDAALTSPALGAAPARREGPRHRGTAVQQRPPPHGAWQVRVAEPTLEYAPIGRLRKQPAFFVERGVDNAQVEPINAIQRLILRECRCWGGEQHVVALGNHELRSEARKAPNDPLHRRPVTCGDAEADWLREGLSVRHDHTSPL